MALENVLLNLANGVPRHRKKFLFTLLGGLLAAYYYNRNNKKLQKECAATKDERKNEIHKVGVNLAFIQQLKKIIPICIPGRDVFIFIFQFILMIFYRNRFKRIWSPSWFSFDFDSSNGFRHLVHSL